MALISISGNKYLIYPIIGGLCKLIVNVIVFLISGKLQLDDHPFCSGINAGLGMSLAFIPYLIISKYEKNKKEELLFENLDIITEDKKEPNLNKGKYLIIFLCAFLDFLQKIIVYMFCSHIYTNISLFNIIFLYLFSLIIDKFDLYRHHYISGGIMIVSGIGLNVMNLLIIKVNQIPFLFLSIFIEITYSLCIVLAKYGIEHKSCSPFEITFYEGIFALVLNIIFLAISSNIPLSKNFKYLNILKVSEYNGNKYLDHFSSYFPKMSLTEILLFIATLIGRVSFNIFTHLTLKHLNIFHVMFILIIGEITLNWKGKKIHEIILTAVILVIELFMLLILCEILELNFCELNKNTQKNMKKMKQFIIYDDDSKDSKEMYNELELNIYTDTAKSSKLTFNNFLGI